MTELADEPSSLLDWVTGLATDPALRARFADEPRSVLDEQGLAGLTPADLHHALPLVSDSVAARLGADVDTAALAGTAAQLAGEDPASALARQLGVVTESVLAAGVTTGPVHGIDDDPVDLDDLDSPAGPADARDDLDDPDDLDDLDGPDPGGEHDLDGTDDPTLASVTVLPVAPFDPVDEDDPLDEHDPPEAEDDDGDVPGLVVGTPAEDPWAPGPDGYADPSPPGDGPDPDDPGPDGADAEWFA